MPALKGVIIRLIELLVGLVLAPAELQDEPLRTACGGPRQTPELQSIQVVRHWNHVEWLINRNLSGYEVRNSEVARSPWSLHYLQNVLDNPKLTLPRYFASLCYTKSR